ELPPDSIEGMDVTGNTLDYTAHMYSSKEKTSARMRQAKKGRASARRRIRHGAGCPPQPASRLARAGSGIPRRCGVQAAGAHPSPPRQKYRLIYLSARHFAHRIAMTVSEAHGARIRHWFETKKAGWYAVLEDPRMPAMSTVLDQAHNAMDRKLFAMKGFHHPG